MGRGLEHFRLAPFFKVKKLALDNIANLSVSLTLDSSPDRGASGENEHFAGIAKASPIRRGGNAKH